MLLVKEFDYAYKKVQELFSAKELETGIFCELNKKGEPMNRSKIHWLTFLAKSQAIKT